MHCHRQVRKCSGWPHLTVFKIQMSWGMQTIPRVSHISLKHQKITMESSGTTRGIRNLESGSSYPVSINGSEILQGNCSFLILLWQSSDPYGRENINLQYHLFPSFLFSPFTQGGGEDTSGGVMTLCWLWGQQWDIKWSPCLQRVHCLTAWVCKHYATSG